MNEEEWDDLSIKEFTDLQKFAIVTKRAIETNSIGFCYRENSEIKIDSGWRFLSGDEDEMYLENPENSLTKDMKDVIEWKPAVKSLLKARPGQEFEWNENNQEFDRL